MLFDPRHPHQTASAGELSEPRFLSRRAWKRPALVLLLVLLGVAGGIVSDRLLLRQFSHTHKTAADASQNTDAPALQKTTGNDAKVELGNFAAAVVDKVGPAVVRIDSSRTIATAPEVLTDPFLQELFGVEPPMRQEIERGIGSGFIIKSDGEILTNAHVVDKADTVKVTLKDGRTFTGKVLGADPVTDIAVVKVNAKDLPTVPMGNSDQARPGQWAIAIGNPLGLNNTVTEGIISATGRSSDAVGVPNDRVDFLQTDAAINPGNSGGPLLNASGEVIGINTAIIKGAQGIGFAIPINTAKAIAKQLVATGKVDHPYLGVRLLTLSPELKQEINHDDDPSLSVDRDRGVLIAAVMPNSPAAQAGLQAGDVIDQLNGQPVTTAKMVQQKVEQSQVGDPLQVTLYRQGKSVELTVHTGSMPDAGQ